MADSDAPHGAALLINYEICQRLPSGEMDGSPVLAKKMRLGFNAPNQAEAVRRLNELLDDIRKRCTWQYNS